MTDPYYEDDLVTLHHGDCLDVLRELDDESIDAVVTDPPYALEFMGRGWDKFTPLEFELWVSQWAAECLRVLKPGGHMLAFGGSRTWHRLAAGVEDAGFEIRDSIAWLYGSGFPKSLDVSKAIDAAAGATREVVGQIKQPTGANSSIRRASQAAHGYRPDGPEFGQSAQSEIDVTAPATDAARAWEGWGTALKPAFEPVVVARKPLTGTVAATVLAYGTGALNIDASRVGEEERSFTPKGIRPGSHNIIGDDWKPDNDPKVVAGRWPTNVVLDESQAAELDRQSGVSTSKSANRGELADMRGGKFASGSGVHISGSESVRGHDDTGGASRFFPTFRYEAKAPTSERPKAGDVAHPTVKPLDLMRWLVRLVTPPGGTVLEPFAGSGTTLEAAVLEGFTCIGIEREADYLPLIEQRLAKPMQQSLFDDLEGVAS